MTASTIIIRISRQSSLQSIIDAVNEAFDHSHFAEVRFRSTADDRVDADAARDFLHRWVMFTAAYDLAKPTTEPWNEYFLHATFGKMEIRACLNVKSWRE